MMSLYTKQIWVHENAGALRFTGLGFKKDAPPSLPPLHAHVNCRGPLEFQKKELCGLSFSFSALSSLFLNSEYRL